MTNNWTNIHHSFNKELQNQWENHGFTYHQVQDWINIGLTPQDANFVNWLENNGHTALAVLNYADSQVLRKDYEKSLTSPQPFSFPHSPKPWWKLLIAFLLTLIATYLLTN